MVRLHSASGKLMNQYGTQGTCRSETLSTINPTHIGLVFDFVLHVERPANGISNNTARNFEAGRAHNLCCDIILQQLKSDVIHPKNY
jgi:hypothetical protein